MLGASVSFLNLSVPYSFHQIWTIVAIVFSNICSAPATPPFSGPPNTHTSAPEVVSQLTDALFIFSYLFPLFYSVMLSLWLLPPSILFISDCSSHL